MSNRKLAAASFANLLIPISGLLVSPFLSRELGPENRGLYAALTLPIVVYGWLGTFGLQDALSFHVRNGTVGRRAAAKVSVVASLPLGVLSIVLLAALGMFVFDDDPDQYRHFLVLVVLAPLHVTSNLLIGGLTGASDIRGVNRVKVIPALARTGLVIFACLAFDLDAFWAALLFVITAAFGVVSGLRSLWNAPDDDGPPPAAIPTRSLFTYAMACLPGSLAAVSSARLDQIVGLPVIGAKELGYYAVAVSVAEIPMVIATAARTVLLGRSGSADPRRETQFARLAVAASVFACGFLALIATVAVPFVFGAEFTPAVKPTLILCLATVLYTNMTLFTAVLLANGKAGWSSTALVAGSVCGVVMLFVLAPLGAVGAALASLVGYGVSVVVAAVALRRAGTSHSLRMLTVLYRDDLVMLQDQLISRVNAVAPRRHAGRHAR
ncbi:lipopolysaccharide biosynthesis protein [Dactylosporangium sp. CA-092794]|uniref:lipopolysaccharide biosynthesis protein n=1 Tax=Dactylosporangium sp. CA-092794 TaxID=3239929 RepID=UPI003D89D832